MARDEAGLAAEEAELPFGRELVDGEDEVSVLTNGGKIERPDQFGQFGVDRREHREEL